MSFIHQDFLLHSNAARRLYADYAQGQPIIDYHCHLPPAEVAENRRFGNLTEIWLDGDHYKWRAMRSNGVDESYCTGAADPYEKFIAWCRTVPYTLRNPLYHWSHLELKRYFDIDLQICEDTAPEIWQEANRKLETEEMSAHGILDKFKVHLVGTTDDPADSLESHRQILKMGLSTKIVPTFRPDKALGVHDARSLKAWLSQLELAADEEIGDWRSFISALKSRHDSFHEMGARLSDHGLQRCFFMETSETEAASIFEKALAGQDATELETEAFAFYLMREVARWNHEKGWVMQLHVGAIRNNNTRSLRSLGPDTGFDSIGDFAQVGKMSRFLDSLDASGQLPKTIIYNLNPADNYAMATMIGNFQDGTVPGKLQLGSGWWFLDQKEGMEAQLNALSNLGLLSRFVGMLTDSRSFLSYPRHEYFRRILCNLLGRDMELGELPRDFSLVGNMVRSICYNNARDYFGFDLHTA